MKSKQPDKILIILLGAIGDVTRALPLAVRIKRRWPDTRLYWAIEPRSLGVIKGHPAIDEIVVFDRPQGISAYLSFISRLRAEKFDLVLDLQRHLKSGFSSWSTGSPRRLGFNRGNAKEFNWVFNNLHIDKEPAQLSKIIHYQRFGDYLGLPPLEPLEFGLTSSVDEIREVRELIQANYHEGNNKLEGTGSLNGYVALIIGSTWPSRFWIARYFGQLMEQLYRQFLLVPVLVGSKGEEEFCQEILSMGVPTPRVNLVSKLKLEQLKSLFAQCSLAIGSDTGPTHIAGACGLPVISIWGPTSPSRCAPYGGERYTLTADVPCSPCFRRTCPGLGHICMKNILPSNVLSKVAEIVADIQVEKSVEVR